MSELRKKIEEVESKDKRSKVYYALALVVTLAVFAGIYLLYEGQKGEVREKEEMVSTIKTEVANVKTEIEAKTAKVIVLDSVKRNDSVKKYEISTQTQEVQMLLGKIKKETSDQEILQSIALIEDKLGIIEGFSTDSTIVRYYKRKADGDAIENAIQELRKENFKLNIKEPSSNLQAKSNTVYYGKKVKPERIRLLVEQLRKNGVIINKEDIIPFYMGYDWKDEAMEIGYESKNPREIRENSRYVVRIYSYREKDVETQKLIGNFLAHKGYKIDVKPRLRERDNNYAKRTTIFYFDRNDEARAKQIAESIYKDMKIKMAVKYSPPSAASAAIAFSIHYDGDLSVR